MIGIFKMWIIVNKRLEGENSRLKYTLSCWLCNKHLHLQNPCLLYYVRVSEVWGEGGRGWLMGEIPGTAPPLYVTVVQTRTLTWCMVVLGWHGSPSRLRCIWNLTDHAHYDNYTGRKECLYKWNYCRELNLASGPQMMLLRRWHGTLRLVSWHNNLW